MSSFSLTLRAKTDLMSIARFTEKAGDENNVLFKLSRLMKHLLSNTPVIGKSCDHIKKAAKNFLKAATLFSILRTTKKYSDRAYST